MLKYSQKSYHVILVESVLAVQVSQVEHILARGSRSMKIG